MPIITTQRRMAEQGRIRLGHKISGTSQAGRAYTRPAKLEKFRFTSPSERQIREIADNYGGEARPWDNDGKAEFEVISDATAIPVIVVKGGFSQWHEFWTKGGCQHRCDGEKDVAGNYCDPQDPNHLAAIEKPTTRLSVMLSEIESLGVWRMESKGWNAAAELPSMAELAMHVGDLVPATLGLAERSSIVQTDKGPQTSRYVVPYLDLHVTKQRLVELVSGSSAPALEASSSSAPALKAPASADTGAVAAYDQALAAVAAATDLDRLAAVWDIAKDQGLVGTESTPSPERDNFVATWKARAHEIKDAVPAPAAQQPDEDGAVDAELVPDTAQGSSNDADAIWHQILTATGALGWDLDMVTVDFRNSMGMSPNEASAAELSAYLQQIRSGEQVPA